MRKSFLSVGVSLVLFVGVACGSSTPSASNSSTGASPTALRWQRG